MFNLSTYRKNNQSLTKKDDIFEQFFDNFLDDFLQPFNDKIEERFNTFKVDVIERDDSFIIEADLPGFEKDNVTIEYDNNYLTISAKKEENEVEVEGNFIRRERKCGEFRRSFFIENVLTDQITAAFKNGVLRVELGKNKKLEAKRVITIE